MQKLVEMLNHYEKLLAESKKNVHGFDEYSAAYTSGYEAALESVVDYLRDELEKQCIIESQEKS